jgi:hypothetical protein
MPAPHTSSRRRSAARLARAAAVALLACAAAPAAAGAATTLYPDLRTLPPSDLRFDTVNYNGVTSNVLRFSNTAWNAGQGPLELHGTLGGSSTISQRLFDDAGGGTFVTVANDFVFHPGHNHFHFEDFAEYELWTKADFDAWVASGRSVGGAKKVGDKTTFCIMDTGLVKALPGSPSTAVYSQCGATVQGMSVGWGDTYGWQLPEQWIDLGGSFLADGSYVLRSVADPRNKLYESPNRSDASRESAQANEAITAFTVRRGRIKAGR